MSKELFSSFFVRTFSEFKEILVARAVLHRHVDESHESGIRGALYHLCCPQILFKIAVAYEIIKAINVKFESICKIGWPRHLERSEDLFRFVSDNSFFADSNLDESAIKAFLVAMDSGREMLSIYYALKVISCIEAAKDDYCSLIDSTLGKHDFVSIFGQNGSKIKIKSPDLFSLST